MMRLDVAVLSSGLTIVAAAGVVVAGLGGLASFISVGITGLDRLPMAVADLTSGLTIVAAAGVVVARLGRLASFVSVGVAGFNWLAVDITLAALLGAAVMLLRIGAFMR